MGDALKEPFALIASAGWMFVSLVARAAGLGLVVDDGSTSRDDGAFDVCSGVAVTEVAVADGETVGIRLGKPGSQDVFTSVGAMLGEIVFGF